MKPQTSIIRDKLLIVDDDSPTRLLVRVILRDSGITTIEACNGIEALELIKRHYAEIFLILLDIILPACDGWTVLKECRKICPDIPVIAVSGTFTMELQEKSAQAGLTKYISKPFNINEMKEIICSYYKS